MKHSWPKHGARFVDPFDPRFSKTERSCNRPGCEITRVTRHTPDRDWIEFYRDGLCIAGAGEPTPRCEGDSHPLPVAAQREGVAL